MYGFNPLGVLAGILPLLLLWGLGLFVLYWVVRLAVRHGILDAQRRPLPPTGPDGPR